VRPLRITERRSRDTSCVARTNVEIGDGLYLEGMDVTRAQLTWKTDYRSLAVEAVGRVVRLPALKELPLAEHVEVRAAAANILDFLALRPAGGTLAPLVDDVDFPGFVADLIRGMFDAIVDATVAQAEAYAELLNEVSATVDEFLQDVDDECLRRLQAATADLLLSGIYGLTHPG
jgi:hypothetical protein